MMWWRWNEDDKCWQPTLVPPRAPFSVNDHARLIPINDARHWALLSAGAAASVNGRPCLPIEILDDRDEVRLAGEHFCLSTESPAEVVAFDTATSARKTIRCARCQGDLVEGDPIVRCARCRAHHHASCWSYDTRCLKCGLPTSGAPWAPEPLN